MGLIVVVGKQSTVGLVGRQTGSDRGKSVKQALIMLILLIFILIFVALFLVIIMRNGFLFVVVSVN
jgi:hypothetical protein